MLIKKRLKNYPRHQSVKGEIGYQLYCAMAQNEDVYLVVGDLGYKVFDPHKEDFPDRVIDVGAAEQTMLGVAIGLALMGKIPFVYSITNFVIYRPFEWIRTYLEGEQIPVKLMGGGLGCDYKEDGLTHQCEDLPQVLSLFPHIKQCYPKTIKGVEKLIQRVIKDKSPYFIGIKR